MIIVYFFKHTIYYLININIIYYTIKIYNIKINIILIKIIKYAINIFVNTIVH